MKLVLNEDQKKAVESRSKQIICLAGAGSGKTRCVIERAKRIADEAGSQSILCLTFTNAAAFEMRERYRADRPNSQSPEFRTFHSFCYWVLSTDADIRQYLGYSAIPSIVDENSLKLIENTTRMEIGFTVSKEKMKDISLLKPKEREKYSIYLKSLDKKLKRRNLITFDKLSESICELFFKDNPLTAKYKKRFRYIFADEFQDTNKDEFRFISSFNDSDVFLVGDISQSIYGFRGSDSSIIKMLITLPGWEVIKLPTNYRSTNQICNFANKILKSGGYNKELKLRGTKDGVDVIVESSDSMSYRSYFGDRDLEYLFDYLNKISGTTALLCRSNREVSDLCDILHSKGYGYDTGGTTKEYHHILKSAADNEYQADWISSYLNADKYAEYIRLCTMNPEMSKLQVLKTWFDTTKDIRKRLSVVSSIRKCLRDVTRPRYQMAADVLDILEYPECKMDVDVSPECSSSELFQAVEGAIENKEKNGMYVGTIHSSKGLEYDNVILFNVGGRSFKLNDEQQWNLYYVGATRAKNNLLIFRKY